MANHPKFSETSILHAGKRFSLAHSDPTDHIFCTIVNSAAFYESELLSAMAKFVRPGDLVVDAGANIGNHTVFLAGVSSCRVMSFEPNPAAFDLLRHNVLANDLGDRVQVFQQGLGAKAGRGVLRAPQAHNLGTGGLIVDDAGEFEISRLDDFADAGQFRMIKIDVEGMDLDVLQGSRAIIERDGPVIAVEAPDRASLTAIAGLLEPFGYGVAGSFNYTPTHIFAKGKDLRARVALPQLSLRQSIDFVDHAVWRDRLSGQIAALRTSAADAAGLHAADRARIEGVLDDVTRSVEEILKKLDAAHAVAALDQEQREQFAAQIADLRKDTLEAADLQAADLARYEGVMDDVTRSLEKIVKNLDAVQAAAANDQEQREQFAAQIADLRKNTLEAADLQAADRARYERVMDDVTRSLEEIVKKLDAVHAVAANDQRQREQFAGAVSALHSEVLSILEMQEASDRSIFDLHSRLAGLEQAVAQDMAGLRHGLAESSAESTRRGDELALALAGTAASLEGTFASLAQGISSDLMKDISNTQAAAREDLTRTALELHVRLVDALRDALGPIGQRLSKLEKAVVTGRTEMADYVERLSDLDGRSALEFQQLHRAGDAAIEVALLVGAAQEAEFSALRTELRSLVRHRLEASLREIVAASLSELKREIACTIGTQFAELQIAARDPLGLATPTGGSELASSLEEKMGWLAALQPTAQSLDDAGNKLPQAAATAAGKLSLSGIGSPSDTVLRGDAKSGTASQEVSPGSEANAVWYVRRPPAQVQNTAPRSATLRPVPQARDTTSPIANEDFSKGWDKRGWAQGDTELAPGGFVRAKLKSKQVGFVTRQFDVMGGGLLEVELHTTRTCNGRHILRIVDGSGDGIGYDFALDADVATFRAFAPARTDRIKVYVLSLDVDAGECLCVNRLVIRLLDPDAHQARVRAVIGEPVLASMASIPSRREMLADCVNSLLLQCDEVRVFLNNYPDIPDVLKHPRIEVRRSQDWDDRGDAGKVFWLERDNKPGYRLIVDDDLIFPPDFAEVMCGKVAAKDKKVIYAAHGVLIRQPIKNYYDRKSRAATFHFARELSTDRSVHIATTGCTCFHSSTVRLRWDDFKYCNSADIWLTIYAQEHDIPVLTPARPRSWIRENLHAVPTETIYRHSLNRTRTRFDSSLVQDAVLKRNWPLTVRVGGRPKYGLLIALGESGELGKRIEQFIAEQAGEAEWIVILACAPHMSEEKVAEFKIERETHLINTAADPSGLSQAKALMASIKLHAILYLDGEPIPADGVVRPRLVTGAPVPWQGATVVTLKESGRRHSVGGILTDGRAVPEDLLRSLEGLALASSSRHAAFAQALRNSKVSSVRGASTASEPTTVNGIFRRIKVLNLDRRPDRWRRVSKSLALAGIQAERFSAVDGSLPEVAAEYARYLDQPTVTVSAEVPPVRYAQDLYMGYASQMARIAHLEKDGKKAIASRGAWGYLKSYEAILEEALADGTESLLVFDDDVLFHKDIKAQFAQAVNELPDNWLILQLGTLQYNWAPPWAEWHSPMLYRTNGSAIGSHAVGMRFDIIPFLLDHVKRFDMPYDIGALSAATRAFPDRCFVIYPNLAIQSLIDSDIGTSEFQKSRKRKEAAAVYRWNLDDYR